MPHTKVFRLVVENVTGKVRMKRNDKGYVRSDCQKPVKARGSAFTGFWQSDRIGHGSSEDLYTLFFDQFSVLRDQLFERITILKETISVVFSFHFA